jgi:hypothetical protein
MDTLNDSRRVVNQSHIFNSLLITAGELGALIPGYDVDFLNALTYLYDCRHYEERRRSVKEPIVIDKPQINLLACCTPSFLTSIMPPGAWEQGFLARTIIIFSDESNIRPLNLADESSGRDEGLRRALVSDIQAIGDDNHFRRLQFHSDAAALIDHWHEGTGPYADLEARGIPDHPRLLHYKTRRTVHLLKLCMIANADRTSNDHISVADFTAALGWLVEAESHMPSVFKAMISGGDAAVINELHHYMIGWTTRQGKPMPDSMLYDWLRERVTANSIQNIVQTMHRSGLIKGVVSEGFACFQPRRKP